MKNILRVFLTDVRRIGTNVVAMVMIMGLCVLPSLYAWFNIFSNWDPYSESATGRIKVAVFSADEGEDLAGESINIGSSVVDELKANSTIGWVFTDTKEEAIDGVYSGDYYAALVIPEDFTSGMVSFLSGEVEHPNIIYYENDKKNAIAPRITDKAKTTVQDEVNASFVSTLAEAVMEAGRVLTLQNDDGETLLDSSISNLKDVQEDLQLYISVMSSFIQLSDAVQNLADTTQSVLPDANGVLDQTKQVVDMTGDVIDYTGDMNETADDMILYSLDSMIQSIDYIQEGIASDQGTLDEAGEITTEVIEQARSTMTYMEQTFQGILEPLGGINADTADQIDEIDSQLQQLSDAINQLPVEQTVDTTDALVKQIVSLTNALKSGLKTFKTTYQEDLSPTLNTTLDTAQNALSSAASTLEDMGEDVDTISPTLQKYQDALANGQSSLENSKALAVSMSDDLQDMIDRFEDISQDEQYQELIDMLENDPDSLGDFVSSPVNLDTQEIYPIATYGSAMAPFYTVLALWVGALILVAIIHVDVVPIKGYNIKPYQAYFGRYILFFLMGQVQALITVLGELFYIQIQCLNPFLYWLAAAATSFVFTLFMYSLTVAMHNVGQALAVVIMVIQVAGAGGTYPIEVLPEVYRMIYKYLPFPYAMNSLRETIGGMYKMNYWVNLGKLCGYIFLALFIGLVLAKLFKKLNHKIEKSKKKTEIMV